MSTFDKLAQRGVTKNRRPAYYRQILRRSLDLLTVPVWQLTVKHSEGTPPPSSAFCCEIVKFPPCNVKPVAVEAEQMYNRL